MENEKAIYKFNEKTNESQKRLAELQKYLDTYTAINPDEINWGDVGSMGYLLQQLNELTDWAYKRGEFEVDSLNAEE